MDTKGKNMPKDRPKRPVDKENMNKKVLMKTFDGKYKFVKDLSKDIIVTDVLPKVVEIAETANRVEHENSQNLDAELVSKVSTSFPAAVTDTEEDACQGKRRTNDDNEEEDENVDDFAGDLVSSVLSTIADEYDSDQVKETENTTEPDSDEEEEIAEAVVTSWMAVIAKETNAEDGAYITEEGGSPKSLHDSEVVCVDDKGERNVDKLHGTVGTGQAPTPDDNGETDEADDDYLAETLVSGLLQQLSHEHGVRDAAAVADDDQDKDAQDFVPGTEENHDLIKRDQNKRPEQVRDLGNVQINGEDVKVADDLASCKSIAQTPEEVHDLKKVKFIDENVKATAGELYESLAQLRKQPGAECDGRDPSAAIEIENSNKEQALGFKGQAAPLLPSCAQGEGKKSLGRRIRGWFRRVLGAKKKPTHTTTCSLLTCWRGNRVHPDENAD